jgi:phospholipid/cholesterol/gamma-HCH transport system substrate-binding protein
LENFVAQKSNQNAVVGMFVLTGIIVLTGLVFMFGGGRTIFTNAYEVNVLFPDGVVGVQPGQSVTLGGKRIGETKDVKFANPEQLEKGIVVVVGVEREYALPRSSEMLLTSNLIGFGRPFLQLTFHDPKDQNYLPKDGTATIPGRMVDPMDSVMPKEALRKTMDSFEQLARSMTPVAQNLTRMMEARGFKEVDTEHLAANLDTVVQRLDMVLKSFNTIAGDPVNQENLKATLANARQMSENGVRMVKSLESFSADGTRLLQKLTMTAETMSGMLARMDAMIATMSQGKGTVGLMLNDNRLYEEMLLTAKRMTKMLDDMREVLDLAKKGQLRIKAL